MFPSSLWIGTTAEIVGGFRISPPGRALCRMPSGKASSPAGGRARGRFARRGRGAPDEDVVAARVLSRPAAIAPALHLFDRERKACPDPLDVLHLEQGERCACASVPTVGCVGAVTLVLEMPG